MSRTTIECRIRDGQEQRTHGNYIVFQDGMRVAAFALESDAQRFVASLTEPNTVTVHVLGGCVQHVESPRGVNVAIHDYDIPPGGDGPVCTDEDGKEYQCLECGETSERPIVADLISDLLTLVCDMANGWPQRELHRPPRDVASEAVELLRSMAVAGEWTLP